MITLKLNMKVFLSAMCLCLLASGAQARSAGAPLSACESMTPQHLAEIQPLPAPYLITASAIDATRYQVTIQAEGDSTFRGFLIQARSNLTDTAVGTFEAADDAQSIDCFDSPSSAATHIAKDDKTSVSVVWTAPQSGEDFFFVASVVKTFNTYWVKLPVAIV